MSKTQTQTKQPKEIRTCVVPVRFTQRERSRVLEMAGALSLSEYLRNQGLGKPQRPKRIPAINRATYIELGRIGNNINQMARAWNWANKQGDQLPPLDLSVIEELRKLINQVRKEVIVPPGQQEQEEDIQKEDWEPWLSDDLQHHQG